MIVPMHILDYWWALPILLVVAVVGLMAWLRTPPPLDTEEREQRPAS